MYSSHTQRTKRWKALQSHGNKETDKQTEHCVEGTFKTRPLAANFRSPTSTCLKVSFIGESINRKYISLSVCLSVGLSLLGTEDENELMVKYIIPSKVI